MTHVIDLAAYNSPGVRVYAGRVRGESARKAARLEQLDQTNDDIEIRIPDDIFSINSSFFLGMFGDSIRQLGEELFRKRYRFVGEGIDLVLEDGIREALRTSSPLNDAANTKAGKSRK